MNGEHATTSQHARLLVLLAEHMPVVGRHLFDDHPTIECACGNPLYTGHLVVLLAGLDQPSAALAAQDGDQGEAVCDCYPGGFTADTFEGPQRHCPVHGDGRGEAVREALDEVERRIIRAIETLDNTTNSIKIVREVRDRRAPESGATP